METSEIEYNLLSIGEPKLHNAMCRSLCATFVKISALFPDLESARPRSTSGIQALCSLHVAHEKAKNLLQHCADSSKLYLAITSEAVVLKFEKSRRALVDSLVRVEDIVPPSIGSQISEIINELANVEFSLDPVEKRIGDDIILLLQKGRNSNPEKNELESFHGAVSKLGITSSRSALRERRALKKLLEQAVACEDKRKKSIVAYLLHLMKKHSNLFKSDFSEENDSTPCSPMSRMSSFNFKANALVPPEELRCPISLQLMYDPVVISSGQTYERACIEKWFGEGHDTCPKTRHQLSHFSLTPNYCVKGLVSSWCEHNRIPIPDAPPVFRDIDYWTLALSSGSDSTNSKSIESVGSCRFLEVNCEEEYDDERFLTVLAEGSTDLETKRKVVEKIRHLLREDEEARIRMGGNGFVEALLRFLESSLYAGDPTSRETGAMALFNLGLNNDRNKELMLSSGVLSILQKMTANNDSIRSATALYMNLSCLEAAKPLIGASEAVPFLISILDHEDEVQCKLDALHALYNISGHPPNISRLLSAGIISSLATILDVGGPAEQERAVSCLLELCNANEACCQVVLKEGVIPSLVSIAANGSTRGRKKAQKLLVLFRGQRQQDPPTCFPESGDVASPAQDPTPSSCKPISRRKLGKRLSFWMKSKSFSVL